MKQAMMINASRVEINFHYSQLTPTLLSTFETTAEPIMPQPEPQDSVLAQRFCAQGESVVDAKTGLMWSANDLPGERLTHADAIAAVAAYRGDGHSDWRLPTREELLSLVDDTRCDPAINTTAFPTCKSAYYWTSSPWALSPQDCAWIVGFGSGLASYYHRDYGAFVRAVRAVSPGQ